MNFNSPLFDRIRIRPTCEEPAKSMDHTLADAVYDYQI